MSLLPRRRRENVAGGRQHSHRVLVTPLEEARLLVRAEAQRVTVPRLLVEAALAEGGATRVEREDAMRELYGLRRELAELALSARRDGAGELLEVTRSLAGRIDAVLDALAVRA